MAIHPDLIPVFFLILLGTVGLIALIWLSSKRGMRKRPAAERGKLFTAKKELTDSEKRAISEKIRQSRTETLKKMPNLDSNRIFILVAIIGLGILSLVWVLMLISRGFRKW
ncbi:MAG: hypothetical protein OXN17_15680 [Candidatus Poribacteria bacterium]|nr:hypothetical protein [Candidatus Poribacteria bacterium]MDE0503974.1 hypothetical protein [Candidatus Poribacteria bacterium]